MSTKRDYYEILGVNKNATEKEIKTAYRSLAKQYHPDKLKDGTSDQKMKELNEAYEILSNSEKRNIYDKYGRDAANGRAGSGGFDASGFEGFQRGFGGFEDIFENIFGGFGSSSRKSSYNQPQRGDDEKIVKVISFMQSIQGDTLKETMNKYDYCLHCGGTGAESKSDISSRDKCNGNGYTFKKIRSIFGTTQQSVVCGYCSGTGKKVIKQCSNCRGNKYIKTNKNVNIPIAPGTDNNTLLKLNGYGKPGINGGPSGDLYIEIKVQDHKYFHRKGYDLYLDFPVSFVDIMLENNILVPTPYGNITITLKKSYESGQIIKIPGKGVQHKNYVGDLKLILKIIKPTISRTETKELTKILEKLNDTSNSDFTNIVNKTLK
ncbi:DnaJ C-terminal domain-containing protein [Mycoplasmopsis cynos]|uniref:DnaJ C-terminal domain-containing protein n=1 Tax=Mycoplasmopsis cynos TaxID=171284 RepID=UPI0024C9CF71|nr:DnaJ C-terminal domain-containing protein [Mycoplasmopsis cynos]WAM08738.1 DnaJ domain-containing protein [Mycoplasmopsis cynos]